MAENQVPEVADFYKNLPKVELHRHLEGSLRVKTMMEIVRAHEMDVKNTGYLRPLVQVDHEDPYTFENFLAKFGTLRLFYKSPDIIKRITWEAVEDAALDNIRYLELRFTPVALSRAKGFPMTQVVDWVIESVQEASAHFDILVRLLISMNQRENARALLLRAAEATPHHPEVLGALLSLDRGTPLDLPAFAALRVLTLGRPMLSTFPCASRRNAVGCGLRRLPY